MKWKELEIVYQNAIYICIIWCILLVFSEKNADFNRTQEMCPDLYIFWIFFR